MSEMKRDSEVAKRKAILLEMLGISDPSAWNIINLIAFFVFLGWFGDTTLLLIQAVIGQDFTRVNSISHIIGVFPFLLSLLWNISRWKLAQKRTMKTKAEAADVEPHKGVVLFLSAIDESLLESAKGGDLTLFDQPRFAWTQCLRGLEPHKEILKHVWVVCSLESAPQFEAFLGLFSQKFPNVSFKNLSKHGEDFSDVTSMVDAIETIYHVLPKGVDEPEVIIDITSGTKTASIAGLLVTMVSQNRDVQYVLIKKNGSQKVKTYRHKIVGLVKKEVKEVA